MLHLNFKNILFLDIETVPEKEHFSELPENLQRDFEKKTAYQRQHTDASPDEFYSEKAGIWAEFGKIICISVGFFVENNPGAEFRIRSYYGEEKRILQDFKQLLDTYYNTQDKYLCAHNGKEFDFPYIARRMIIHQIDLPEMLRLFGKKPWEVPHLDTLELWRFGDYKHYTSLSLLTSILGIPSPKSDLDGSKVAQVFYQENDIQRIVEYCEADTLAVAQVLLRYSNLPLISTRNIVKVRL